MRRSLPAALQSAPAAAVPAPLRRTEEASCLSVALELDCVTPVIGGGVESYTPDGVDLVRVHGIRGQLRAFWRALESNPLSSEKLFESEVALWGGVTEAKASLSRVEISVEVPRARKGIVAPAGWHEPRRNGGFSALPKWSGDPALGYALFPLQCKREELDSVGENVKRVPTRSTRKELGFTLRLRVAPRVEAGAPIPFDADRLLGALFCWVYFGGLGGRTTRGFGALALRGDAEIEGLDAACGDVWKQLFRGPGSAEDVTRWLRKGLARAGAQIREDGRRFAWPTLHGADWLLGPPKTSPEAAHACLLAEIQAFRQRLGVAREPGQDQGRPGRSRWPEPDTLRRLAKQVELVAADHRWEHPPRDPRATNCAPRAAFGLPIVASFKFTDRGDANADATLELSGSSGANAGSRWISPVRLRPLRCGDRSWVPLAIALSRRPGRDDEKVRVRFKKTKRRAPNEPSLEIPIRGHSGAEPPIAGHLAKHNGDAVAAFLDWLVAERGFKRVGGGA